MALAGEIVDDTINAGDDAPSVAKRRFAAITGIVSFIYLFVPEPTDLVPIIGWLDEGVAGMMLLWSLRTLGLDPKVLAKRLLPFSSAPKLVR